MNIFRFCGDMLHLASIMLLVFKLNKSKNCAGVSCRMQEMYAITFCFRYMDLFWSFISLYNTSMKLIFITSTFFLIYLMRFKAPTSLTYERKTDSFPYEKYLLGPCLILGFLLAEEWTLPDILWSSSIFIEAVSLLPQTILMQNGREIENLTADFVCAMGAYRFFYILNWIYRYFAEGYVNPVGWFGGVVQTGLYCDFFYFYAKSKWFGDKLVLPMAGGAA